MLPSREAILAALRNAGTPLPPADLERELAVGPVARDAFYGRLAAMERDGQVLTNRKRELCVVAKLDLIVGTVQGHPDGFGFLVPDEGGDDYFLSPREMHKVLHGDRAALRKTGTDRRGRPEGEIVEVLERANREIVGRLYEERGIWFVVAENRRINQDLLIPPGDLGGATPGQVVVAEIVEQPAANREAIARIKEVLGSATDSGIEIEIALRKHALPFEFSPAPKHRPGGFRPRCAPPTARTASTSPNCRSSPSTARPPRTSTTPSTASARAGISAWSSPSPTSRIMSATATRSIAMRASAAHPFIFPGA